LGAGLSVAALGFVGGFQAGHAYMHGSDAEGGISLILAVVPWGNFKIFAGLQKLIAEVRGDAIVAEGAVGVVAKRGVVFKGVVQEILAGWRIAAPRGFMGQVGSLLSNKFIVFTRIEILRAAYALANHVINGPRGSLFTRETARLTVNVVFSLLISEGY